MFRKKSSSSHYKKSISAIAHRYCAKQSYIILCVAVLCVHVSRDSLRKEASAIEQGQERGAAVSHRAKTQKTL